MVAADMSDGVPPPEENAADAASRRQLGPVAKLAKIRAKEAILVDAARANMAVEVAIGHFDAQNGQ
jgi:hypothetical protein